MVLRNKFSEVSLRKEANTSRKDDIGGEITDTGDYMFQDSHKFRNLEETDDFLDRLPEGNQVLENPFRTNATEQPGKIYQGREAKTRWSRTPSSPEHLAPLPFKPLRKNGKHFSFLVKTAQL